MEINDFVDESTLLNLIEHNFEIESVPSGLSLTKSELIQKFRAANKLLRKSGLRNGYERFSVFSDLLFLKLKDDLSDIGEDLSQNKDLDRICNWRKLIDKMPKKKNGNFIIEESEVKTYLEDTIKRKLKESYGDIFDSSLNIKDEKNIIGVNRND